MLLKMGSPTWTHKSTAYTCFSGHIRGFCNTGTHNLSRPTLTYTQGKFLLYTVCRPASRQLRQQLCQFQQLPRWLSHCVAHCMLKRCQGWILSNLIQNSVAMKQDGSFLTCLAAEVHDRLSDAVCSTHHTN